MCGSRCCNHAAFPDGPDNESLAIRCDLGTMAEFRQLYASVSIPRIHLRQTCMFTSDQIVDLLTELGITHVVYLPDSTLGQWNDALHAASQFTVVQVCREGEAWAVAAGLYLGGANPLVMIQCTGLFESGDALRNAVHDFQLPLFAIVGYRSYLNQETLPGDTCLKFTEPILNAWELDYRLITKPDQLDEIRNHYRACQSSETPGVALLAEGRA